MKLAEFWEQGMDVEIQTNQELIIEHAGVRLHVCCQFPDHIGLAWGTRDVTTDQNDVALIPEMHQQVKLINIAPPF